MKLLFFISSLRGGGAERVMVTLCNELSARGHEIYLTTNKRLPFAYELDNKIIVLELIPNNFDNANKLFRIPKLYSHVRLLVKKVKPDIITSFIHGLNVHIILSTLGLRIPIVASEHFTFDKKHSLSQYFNRFYVNRLANRTVLLTDYDYKFLGKRLKNKTVIPNPLSFPISIGSRIRQKHVIAAGSIDRWEHKGFDNLIKVWANIAPKFPDWKLQIAGKGSEKNFEFLREIVKDKNVVESVEFIGFQSKLDELLQRKSIFILSSRWEGLPMILLEAISQGCACISFDCISGPREIIKHGISGLLVENQNMIEMEKTLTLLMVDEDLRSELSQGGLRDIDRFSPRIIVNEWEKMFHELLIP